MVVRSPLDAPNFGGHFALEWIDWGGMLGIERTADALS